MKLLLILLALLVGIVSVTAVALHHFFGWKGLIAFPFVLLALAWVGKFLVRKLFERFALGLFAMKSKVLRGATLNVHSIVPVPKPVVNETTATGAIDVPDEGEDKSAPDAADKEPDPDHSDDSEPEEPRHYYAMDLTITPVDGGADQVWEPGELMLTSERVSSLEELEGKEVGTTDESLIWNGTEFGPDDVGKYPGAQRLKITFAVKPGTSRAWLQYYDEGIGEVELPVWKV